MGYKVHKKTCISGTSFPPEYLDAYFSFRCSSLPAIELNWYRVKAGSQVRLKTLYCILRQVVFASQS